MRRCSIVICPVSSTPRSPYTVDVVSKEDNNIIDKNMCEYTPFIISTTGSFRLLRFWQWAVLERISFSEANEWFMVAAFSQKVARFHMEVCLESFTGGLAMVEPVTLTSIVLIKYEGGELLNNYYSYCHKGQILHTCIRLKQMGSGRKIIPFLTIWPPETLIKGRMRCKSNIIPQKLYRLKGEKIA